jgi:ABC-type Fe3+/spermidine/putrescine transport system ATPase subunit
MTSVRLDHIYKRFDKTTALDGIDLTIGAGELFFLLGPSGCGKSTLLRMIAGLHEPTCGRIWFNDRDVTPLGTDKRNAVMCFQSYALWPHMTVRQNVAFGLEVRKVPPAEMGQRVDEVLKLVQMDTYAARKPNQLSGGQQQRVALARALAVKPDCLLLDEPLSNLDAKLRHEMRSEIRRICKTAGFTTIYVTHDQKEALSVADRIAVMNGGRIEQYASPDELYRRPATLFTAEFVGSLNRLDDAFAAPGTVRLGQVTLPCTELTGPAGSGLTVGIRPEEVRLDGTSAGASARVEKVLPRGHFTEVVVELEGGPRLRSYVSGVTAPARGEVVRVRVGQALSYATDPAVAAEAEAA